MTEHGHSVTGRFMNRAAQESPDGPRLGNTHSLRICVGPTCGVNFSSDLLDETEDRPRADLEVQRCGCLGHCEEGPNLMLNGTVHVDMTPERLRSLLTALPHLPVSMGVTR